MTRNKKIPTLSANRIGAFSCRTQIDSQTPTLWAVTLLYAYYTLYFQILQGSKKFHRQTAADETIDHIADFQVPGLEALLQHGMEDYPTNIQIFGTEKCSGTRKAERYFKERSIKYQSISLKEGGMSKGEYTSVKQVVGGLDAMLSDDCEDEDVLALIKHITAENQDEKVLENQKVLKSPIVRNGKKATIGYQPEVWETWD